eukprot:2877206-Rhodomonas_salina.6
MAMRAVRAPSPWMKAGLRLRRSSVSGPGGRSALLKSRQNHAEDRPGRGGNGYLTRYWHSRMLAWCSRHVRLCAQESRGEFVAGDARAGKRSQNDSVSSAMREVNGRWAGGIDGLVEREGRDHHLTSSMKRFKPSSSLNSILLSLPLPLNSKCNSSGFVRSLTAHSVTSWRGTVLRKLMSSLCCSSCFSSGSMTKILFAL